MLGALQLGMAFLSFSTNGAKGQGQGDAQRGEPENSVGSLRGHGLGSMSLVRGALVEHQFSSCVASASGLSLLRTQLLPIDAVKTYHFGALCRQLCPLWSVSGLMPVLY